MDASACAQRPDIGRGSMEQQLATFLGSPSAQDNLQHVLFSFANVMAQPFGGEPISLEILTGSAPTVFPFGLHNTAVGTKTHRHMSRSCALGRGLLEAPLRDLVRPVWWPVRPVSPGSPTRIQRTPAREGPLRGMRTKGCPRLGRLARESSNAIESMEEHHIVVGKD